MTVKELYESGIVMKSASLAVERDTIAKDYQKLGCTLGIHDPQYDERKVLYITKEVHTEEIDGGDIDIETDAPDWVEAWAVMPDGITINVYASIVIVIEEVKPNV